MRWRDLPPLNGRYLLLSWPDNSSIRFLPADNTQSTENGTAPTLTFHAWDKSAGTAGELSSPAALGRSISLGSVTIAADVYAVGEDGRAIHHSSPDNYNAINLDERLKSLEGKGNSYDTKIAALESKNSGYDTKIAALEGKNSGYDTKIAALEAKVTALMEAIEALRGGSSTILNVSQASEGVRSYPNPSSRRLHFANLAAAQRYTYHIYAPTGAQLQSGSLQATDAIDISSLPLGQYVVTLRDEAGKEVLRSALLVK